jgi:hypothetical protein
LVRESSVERAPWRAPYFVTVGVDARIFYETLVKDTPGRPRTLVRPFETFAGRSLKPIDLG